MSRWLLIALHAVLAVAAVAAGSALVQDPSGAPLTFEVEWLDGSPFDGYRVPGLFLAVVIGGTNLASTLALWRRHLLGPLISLGTGALLIVWIVIQTWIIGYNDWTQAMWAAIFLLVAALALREVRAASPPRAIGTGRRDRAVRR